MYKVKINQFGRLYKIYIDGARITTGVLLERLKVTPNQLRRALNASAREQIILDWLIKADAGVHSQSKVYWRKDEFQIVEVVAKKTGITKQAAWSRIITWIETGDTKKLLRKKYLEPYKESE